jgi:hypothetical protein
MVYVEVVREGCNGQGYLGVKGSEQTVCEWREREIEYKHSKRALSYSACAYLREETMKGLPLRGERRGTSSLWDIKRREQTNDG